LREAVLELFLSVKIRPEEEIDGYNEGLFKHEKRELMDVDGFSLIDQIIHNIEIRMNKKIEEQDEIENEE
jgi:hypothetical protein